MDPRSARTARLPERRPRAAAGGERDGTTCWSAPSARPASRSTDGIPVLLVRRRDARAQRARQRGRRLSRWRFDEALLDDTTRLLRRDEPATAVDAGHGRRAGAPRGRDASATSASSGWRGELPRALLVATDARAVVPRPRLITRLSCEAHAGARLARRRAAALGRPGRRAAHRLGRRPPPPAGRARRPGRAARAGDGRRRAAPTRQVAAAAGRAPLHELPRDLHPRALAVVGARPRCCRRSTRSACTPIPSVAADRGRRRAGRDTPRLCRPASDAFANPAKSLAIEFADTQPADRRRRRARRRRRPRDRRRAAAVRRRRLGRRCSLPDGVARAGRCCAAPDPPRPVTTSSATASTSADEQRPRLLVVGDDGYGRRHPARRPLRTRRSSWTRWPPGARPARCTGWPPNSACARPASTCPTADPLARFAAAAAFGEFTAAYLGLRPRPRPRRARARPSGPTDGRGEPRADELRTDESGGSTKAIVAALGANLGIAVIKFVAFAITGVVVDAGRGRALGRRLGQPGPAAAWAARSARRRRDAEHPFGYGRDRYVYGFLVALMLFSAGGLFALYEGVEKIRHPHHLEDPIVAVAVLLVAIGLEGFSLRTAVTRVARAQGRRHVGRLHPAREGPRTAGRAARGRRRAHRPGLRADRCRAGRAHRRAGVGRHRHLRDRRPAHRGRDHPGDRDQEPAARRVRRAGRGARDRGRRSSVPASSGSSTCARCTWARRSCWSGRSWRCRPGAALADVAQAIDDAEQRVRDRRADRPGDLPRARPRRSGSSGTTRPSTDHRWSCCVAIEGVLRAVRRGARRPRSRGCSASSPTAAPRPSSGSARTRTTRRRPGAAARWTS